MQNKSQSGSTGDIALENRRLKNVVSHSLAIFEAQNDKRSADVRTNPRSFIDAPLPLALFPIGRHENHRPGKPVWDVSGSGADNGMAFEL